MKQASSAAVSGDGKAAQPPRPKTRPREIEDGLNFYIYHPLAFRLALALRPTGVSPNAVSVAGAALIVAAGLAYVGLSWPVSALTGFLIHASWHVVDGADGDLARLTGKSSPWGEIVDGLCDYGGHFLLYASLAWMLSGEIGGWAWPIAIAAGLCRGVQSNHAETQKRTYLWWAYGIPWLKTNEASPAQKRNGFAALAAAMGRIYVRIGSGMATKSQEVDRLLDARNHDRQSAEDVRAIVRPIWATPLVLEKWLGANMRTVMLGISMAAGSPLWFFLVEIVPMNLLLLLSLRIHADCTRRVAAALRQSAGR